MKTHVDDEKKLQLRESGSFLADGGRSECCRSVDTVPCNLHYPQKPSDCLIPQVTPVEGFLLRFYTWPYMLAPKSVCAASYRPHLPLCNLLRDQHCYPQRSQTLLGASGAESNDHPWGSEHLSPWRDLRQWHRLLSPINLHCQPRGNDPCPQTELTAGEHLNSTIGTLYPL